MRLPVLVAALLLASYQAAVSEWSLETVTEETTRRQTNRALLPEAGGRATLVIQCYRQAAEAIIYLRKPANAGPLHLFYRFDDDEPQERMATVSPSGHVLRIWNEAEREAFANARRLRIQTKPLVVLDFDLRGIETIAAKLKC